MRKTRAQERYENDPRFHYAVDVMRSILHEGQLDVGSLIEAVTEAANMFAMERGAGSYVVRFEPDTGRATLEPGGPRPPRGW